MGILDKPGQSHKVGGMIGFAETTWRLLEADEGIEPARFDPGTLERLPPPAQRLLAASLPEGTPLYSVVSLAMEGDIKLAGRWLPFTAQQILRAGTGFVWAPTVGGRFLRFVGADVLGPDGARIEFRLRGRIPVVRGSGSDIEHSAIGRLAAETVAWLPQALTPQAGARWDAINDSRSAVTLDVAGTDVRVEVAVDDHGRVVQLGLQRWKDSAKPPTYASFGGSVDSIYADGDGLRIAGGGTVGWDWQTSRQAAGQFFRYRIITAKFGPALADRDKR